MSDLDQDKTKIRSNASTISTSEEFVDVIPADTNDTPIDLNDKTRIAIPVTQSSMDDKTRIAEPGCYQFSAGAKNDVVADNVDLIDTTLFNPEVTAPVDKTRVRPPDQLEVNHDRMASLSSPNTDHNEHGVLKGRFFLESVLGAGGMGVVYKAKDSLKVEAQDRDPYLAIKVLSDEFKSHPEAFISLQRESRKSQRIAHPNIVNVYDFDRDGDTVFMTMEFLDGSPLDQLIRQYKSTGLPTDDAWEIIKGMSSALSHAHAENIIHSDFKPGNVFVTNRGIAKVFDFGIARAVAQVEHLDDNPEDRTVFDAGNLGALTPAYASLEMLQGEEPDVRDDIYALGCVAYELFTGEHPYNKVPADEAERQGLKPKRISNIKKYQWRAIEKAIAFRREDRIESVEQFVDALFPSIKANNRLVSIFAVLLSVVVISYFSIFKDDSIDPYSEFDIRNELELKIKIDFYKEDLEALIKNPTFSDPWQDSTWKDVADLKILTQGKETWLDDKIRVIYTLYLNEISLAIKEYKYTRAKRLIDNAKRYTEDESELVIKSKEIASAIERDRVRKDIQAKKQQENLLVQQQELESKKQQLTQEQKEKQIFDVALENVNNQLKCQGRLNMRNLDAAIEKLRGLDRNRYISLEQSIIKSLGGCITQIGKAFPERALEAKKHSLRIFKDSQLLAGLKIQARDPCDQSLAGLGARGKRAVCKDKVKDIGAGPVLVVIPGNNKIKPFAIGKYEVSVEELNKFCKRSSVCNLVKGRDGESPASEMDFKVVKAYLKWLSKQSGQKYRLPTKNEWIYAAKSRRKKLDANRNCKLSTRGIQKGQELVKASIGKQNSWGLVNYVGNVQEWVYDKGHKLVAVGGSYRESMEDCDITTTNTHNGSADRATGFRVLRELRIDS